MSAVTRPLKQGHVAWISGMIMLDVAILLLALAPDTLGSTTLAVRATSRLAGAAILPPLVLLLSYLIPAHIKAIIVFWRTKHVLPGHRAFTHLAPKDPRIDLTKLKKNIGPLPEAPLEQNQRWYALYKQVANESSVVDSHRHFLLFRDMSAVSALLLPIMPAGLWLLDCASSVIVGAPILLFAQYLLAVCAAQQTGTRFVLNVLALHSATKLGKAESARVKTPAKRKKATAHENLD